MYHKIGLPGAVIMTVGTVIGAGIFILIGPLGVTTGPGLFFCYLAALIVAAGSAVCYAQVAAVFPTTAATYRYARMFYSDYIGFIVGWLRWITACYALALMGMGFADYLGPVLHLDKKFLALGIMLLFYIVNVLGLKTTQLVQGMLVIIVVSGLLAFTGWGLPSTDLSRLGGWTEVGWGPLLQGTAAAFFAYTGLYFIAEIGDEVKNAQRNIPLAIFLSSIILGAIYLSVAIVFSGGLGWEKIKEIQPNLAQAAGVLLPPQLASLVRLSAVVAIFTPINAIYTASSRLLFSLAKDGFLPKFLTRTNYFGAPGLALTINLILGIIVVLFDLSIIFLGALNSLVALVGMALTAGASLQLSRRFPREVARAPMILKKGTLRFWALFTIISTILLTISSFWEDPKIFLSLALWLGAGSFYFHLHKKYFQQKILERKNNEA